MSMLSRFAPLMLAMLRIMAALLFMEHGLMKILHFPAPQPGAPDPLPMLLLAAGWIEIVGGGLLAVGLFTRSAAFVCSGEMAFAYFIAHAPMSFWPALNGGDAAILYCFVFLYISAAGPGSLSIDGVLARKRGAALNFATKPG